MLQIAVCDDCKKDREFLKELLEKYFADKEELYHVSEYSEGQEFVDDYEECRLKADIIFLGIVMEKVNGLDAAKRIRNCDDKVKIIFISRSRDFAVESFEVDALGYLLKPAEWERFERVMDKFLGGFQKACSNSLFIRRGKRGERIPYSEILYLESENTSIYIHLKNGEIIRIYGKLNDYETELQDWNFVRCHRSYIVNLATVISIGQEFLLSNGSKIPIRRKDKKQIRDIFCRYINESL